MCTMVGIKCQTCNRQERGASSQKGKGQRRTALERVATPTLRQLYGTNFSFRDALHEVFTRMEANSASNGG